MTLSINKVSNTVSDVVQGCKNFVEGGLNNPVKSRELTDIDRFNFRAYMHFKMFDFKTTQEELNALFKFNNDEFFTKTYEFFIEKLAIPIKLKPKVVDVPMHESIGMTYDFLNNVIARNTNLAQNDKNVVFGLVRHELQHFIQNINILRTEGIGEQAVDFYSNLAAKQRVGAVDFEVKNLTKEQLKASYNDETIKYYQGLKNLLKNNPQAYDTELKNLGGIFKYSALEQNQNFRNLVVQEMGLIKGDTKSAKRSEKMFAEILKGNGYWKTDGSVHVGQYNFDIRENDAITAQQTAQLKLLPAGQKYCYLHSLKQAVNAFVELAQKDPNNKEISEIVETAQEKLNKFGMKDIISYLYD